MAQPGTPQAASTVVLIRPDRHGGFEIYLNRRPDKMDTYAGVYVFPGGRVEESDYSGEMIALTRGLSPIEAQEKLGLQLRAEICLGYWVAAVRELFEEAGIHFFVSHVGDGREASGNQLFQRLAGRRAALQRGEIDLAKLLVAEGLCCDVAPLRYFFHRVTPSIMRFVSTRVSTWRRCRRIKPRSTPQRKFRKVYGLLPELLLNDKQMIFV